MPGTIRVSVLKAVDLPEILSDGTSSKDLTAKVTLGRRQFKSKSRPADEGRTDFWNSKFVFLVTNLREKLVVAICDNEDRCLTQTTIEVASIIERGSRDELLELNVGGRVHLIMSFILSDEERKRIEAMRVAVLKRREEERARKTVVFRNVQPDTANDLRAVSSSAVTISEVEDSFAAENKDPQETSTSPLGFGSTTKPLPPVLVFDYAKAVGVESRRGCKWMSEKRTFWAAENGQDECLGPTNVLEGDKENIACAKQGVHIITENISLEPPSRLGLRPEARLRRRSKWARKNGLDSRWTSPEKAKSFIRVEWNSRVSASLKARSSILKVIKVAAGSHEAYGDGQFLQERHIYSNSIGAVLNKVVGGAAILLAALFMMWPLSDSSTLRSDGLNGEDP